MQVEEVRGLGRERRARAALAVRHDRAVLREHGVDRDDPTSSVRTARADRRADERHEVSPVEVRARIPVHPRLEGCGRPRHLVVADHVLTVDRNCVAVGEISRQTRKRAIELLREPLVALRRKPLVLDPDRVTIDPPIARVPSDVARRHHLRHLPVRRPQDVVRADVGERILEQRDRRVVCDLGVVDHDEANAQPVSGPIGEVVVPVVTGIGGVLLVRGRDEPARETVRALGPRGLRVPQVLRTGRRRRSRSDLPRCRRRGRRGGRGRDEQCRCGRRNGRDQRAVWQDWPLSPV